MNARWNTPAYGLRAAPFGITNTPMRTNPATLATPVAST
jgi:hypothetical protein